jgi:hypothetical protein
VIAEEVDEEESRVVEVRGDRLTVDGQRLRDWH